jgi:hypothetical protein
MKMVYTNESRFLVGNARNILQAQGIDVVLRNEHASSAIGEVSAFDAWVEIWVLNDSDYSRACAVIEASLSEKDAVAWLCEHCKEENDASFELCWNCQGDRA